MALAAVALVLKLRSADEASSPQSISAPSSSGGSGGGGLDPGGPVRIDDNLPMRSQESYALDLEKLRAEIPDNVYWKLDAPTSDVAVAKERAEQAKRRNTALGRIQANEASEQEIRAYYDERRRVSTDYLQLAKLVLEGKAGEVSDRDRGLFELTVTLHQGRLQQIERDQSDALGRLAARNGSGEGSAQGEGSAAGSSNP